MDKPETGEATHVATADRGFVFISPFTRAGRLFLHRYSYRGEWPPTPGQRVTYRVVEGERSPRAVDYVPLR